ncbi:MAG TPA: glycosyltransferase family 61 protein, partial [Spirochaetia bacterium]|nr:glycosyltransferase family 61 protein [Spirochaetia bacterium]
FHWVCDVLPRLEALGGCKEARDRTLIVPAMASFPYVPESLAAYELPSVRILNSHEAVFCERLTVIPPVAPTGNYRPDLMRAIRERFSLRFSLDRGAKRVFISRSEAPKRRIVNEAELMPVLNRHGVSSLVAERLSLAEQVRLIGRASVLVGSHGAGLSHMLWMKPGSCVVELRRSGDRWNNCYFSLASALDLKYFYLKCDPVRQRDGFHAGNLIVDPRELDRVLSLVDE